MEQTYTIQSELGIHVRPAKQIVEAAKKYPACSVFLEKDGKRVSVKSLVNVLTLGAKHGDTVTLITEGEQEAAVQDEIGAIFADIAGNHHAPGAGQ
ncbi:HPr-like protein Crh [Paenibacillus baekrokdamisoli]|uniref:HPr-like protein Crh n=1 Tax=Paenibacillus baekrokdamisoli TaxID=1712516 RepID=A0A3G9JIT5_9BACL|nr:HPr family phosphocarrier protein [Paenibacillus baekrokdamisoli]MBB3069533.1 phosphocarrier protein [Paenibacillus baekrokdamisoli]BBH24893.1 HPr-like protein Crh [Paenibacillus baekrokdamisoli]